MAAVDGRAATDAQDVEESPWGAIKRDHAAIKRKRLMKEHEASIPVPLKALMREHADRKLTNASVTRVRPQAAAATNSSAAGRPLDPWAQLAQRSKAKSSANSLPSTSKGAPPGAIVPPKSIPGSPQTGAAQTSVSKLPSPDALARLSVPATTSKATELSPNVTPEPPTTRTATRPKLSDSCETATKRSEGDVHMARTDWKAPNACGTASKRSDGDVGASKRSDGDVGASKRSDGDVGASKRSDGDVGVSKRSDGNVGVSKRSDGNVGASKRSDGDVGAAKRSDGDVAAAAAARVDMKGAVEGKPKLDSARVKDESEKAKKEEKKPPEEKKASFTSRLAEQSLKSLQALYAPFRGKRIVNPKPEHCDLPEPVTRASALHRHGRERKLQIGVSQIVDLCDDIWLFGRTNSCATIALRLDGFHPFFFISCPENATDADAKRLRDVLNAQRNRPERWDRSRRQLQRRPVSRDDEAIEPEDGDDDDGGGEAERQAREDGDDDILPVVSVTLERRMNAVIYTGRTKMPVMRLDFANTAAFRHYRAQLAQPHADQKHVGPNPKIVIGWRPQLYHEEHTLPQMLFNNTSINLFDWVQIKPRQCHLLPARAWTDVEHMILLDEERQAEADDGDDAPADDDGEDEAGMGWEQRLERRAARDDIHDRLPRTTAHLEGHCNYKLLKPIKAEAAPPMVIGTFDIETLCWDTVLAQRALLAAGAPPPAFDDDIDVDPDRPAAPDKPDKPKLKPAPAVANVQWEWAWAPRRSVIETPTRLAEWATLHRLPDGAALRTVLPVELNDLSGWVLSPQQVDAPELWIPIVGGTAPDGATHVLYEHLRTHQFVELTAAADGERLANRDDKTAADFFRFYVADSIPQSFAALAPTAARPAPDLVPSAAAASSAPDLVPSAVAASSAPDLVPSAVAASSAPVPAPSPAAASSVATLAAAGSSAVPSQTAASSVTISASGPMLGDGPAAAATLGALCPGGLNVHAPPGGLVVGQKRAAEGAAPDGQPSPKRLKSSEQEDGKMHRLDHKEARNTAATSDAAVEARPAGAKLKKGQFPIPSKPNDAVFLIATQLSVYGDNESFLSVIHALGHCDLQPGDLPDTLVFEFDEGREQEMLEHWSTMVRHFDLEWLAGYNSISYDLPYIFQRAKRFGSTRVVRNLSRFQALPFERKSKAFRYRECLPHERRFGNKGLNDQMPQLNTPGLIQFDAMRVVKNLEKLDSYSLKEVAIKLLEGKVKKKDLPHELLSPFWAAGPQHRRRLAIYNYYDVKVTLAVMIKRFLLGHVVEVARAAWTSVIQQMLQGAQVLIIHHSHHHHHHLLFVDHASRMDRAWMYVCVCVCVCVCVGEDVELVGALCAQVWMVVG